jgi:hypothetical protein
VGEKSGLFEHPARVSSSYASLHAIETLLRHFLKFPPLTPRQPELSASSYREIGARLEETTNNNEKEV